MEQGVLLWWTEGLVWGQETKAWQQLRSASSSSAVCQQPLLCAGIWQQCPLSCVCAAAPSPPTPAGASAAMAVLLGWLCFHFVTHFAFCLLLMQAHYVVRINTKQAPEILAWTWPSCLFDHFCLCVRLRSLITLSNAFILFLLISVPFRSRDLQPSRMCSQNSKKKKKRLLLLSSASFFVAF